MDTSEILVGDDMTLMFWKRFRKPRKSDVLPANEPATVSEASGRWGENVAGRHLERLGWRILDRNSRPCHADRRCEIDLIAFIPSERKVVFVEVKTHRRHSAFANRLWAVDRRKKRNLLRACTSWLMRRRWHGNFRFDVIEVYGVEGGIPEIDHIKNVPLFPPRWRFW